MAQDISETHPTTGTDFGGNILSHNFCSVGEVAFNPNEFEENAIILGYESEAELISTPIY